MCKRGFLGGGDPGPALWQESKQVANLRGYIQGMFLGLESKISPPGQARESEEICNLK